MSTLTTLFLPISIEDVTEWLHAAKEEQTMPKWLLRRCKGKLIETHCEAEKEGEARYIGGTWNEYERRQAGEGKYRAVTTNMHVGSSSRET